MDHLTLLTFDFHLPLKYRGINMTYPLSYPGSLINASSARLRSTFSLTLLPLDSQVLLSDARRTAERTEEALRESEALHRVRADEAAASARDLTGRMERQAAQHREFLKALGHRVDAAVDRLSAVQLTANNGLQQVADKQERLVLNFERSSGVWASNMAEQARMCCP